MGKTKKLVILPLISDLARKKKHAQLLFFACGAPFTEDGLENSNFRAVFFDFLEEFVCDEQTFIEVKQHPQAGPETTHTMCEKFENF